MTSEFTQVVVMRMDADPPSQHTATLAGGQGELLVLRVDDTVAWCRGESVLVVAGAPGDRMFLQSVYVSPNGRYHMIRRVTRWKRFDQRDNQRYGAQMPVRVRSASGWKAEATLEDISSGGLALVVTTEPGDAHLLVEIRANGYRSELPVDVLSMSDSLGGNVLHCRYRELSAPQTAFVRSLLAHLEERAEAAARAA
ncbi:MAG: PilZ domain-containing protein [Dehalococcoidia bacterium]|nr:PilZ domain-containing protein [Dehalococcoidia bacterium]